MKRVFAGVFLLMLILVTGGCEEEKYKYTLRNNSSYTVIVTPKNQDWNSVTFEVDFDSGLI